MMKKFLFFFTIVLVLACGKQGPNGNAFSWNQNSGQPKGYIYVATEGGLSISKDGGATYSNKTVSEGLGNNAVNEVYVDSNDVIYAATNGGLSISKDGGETSGWWHQAL